MASLRQQRLAQFREAILAGERQSNAYLFRLLYGLPAEVQIALLCDMTTRFLPIFRANHPGVTPATTWPETVLADPNGYYDEHERAVEDEPEDSFGGDMSFRFALYALLDAVSYAKQGTLPRVTPACCTGLGAAVSAHADNVWHADDPEAVQAFATRDREALAGRTAHHNVASRAVTKREWLLVADWLEARDVGSYPDTEDAEREKWFEWWQDRECQL